MNFQSACIMPSFGIMSIISARSRKFIPSFRPHYKLSCSLQLSGWPRTDGGTVTQHAAKEEQISVWLILGGIDAPCTEWYRAQTCLGLGLHARCTEYWQPRQFTKNDGIYTVYDDKQGGEALWRVEKTKDFLFYFLYISCLRWLSGSASPRADWAMFELCPGDFDDLSIPRNSVY